MKKINFNVLFGEGKEKGTTGYLVEFPDIPGYKFVVHKSVDEGVEEWVLSEYSTGVSCGRPLFNLSKTREAAIEFSYNKIMANIEIFPELFKRYKIINF